MSRTSAGKPITAATLVISALPLFLVGQLKSQTFTLSQITSPANNTTLAGSSVTFQWTSGTGVSQNYLSIGSAAGGNDIYNQNQGTNTSVTVNGIPTDGRVVYVRLWSFVGGWLFNDYVYTAASSLPYTLAAISYPPNHATLAGSFTFHWTMGTGVSQYYLSIGNSPGAGDIYNQNQGTNTSVTVNGLPTDGRILYARLWSFVGGWLYNDYIYTASTTPAYILAAITSPPHSSTLTGSSVTFQWTTGAWVSKYYLSIGSSVGANDIYAQSQGTNTSVTVNGIPTDGRTIYVRLWSFVGGWLFNDYTYTAATLPTAAMIISPANHSTLSGSSVMFQWNNGIGVSQYYLYVGSSLGTNDIYGQNQGANTSVTVNGIPTDGRTIYVRLWSFLGGWLYNDYTYTAF